MVKKKKVQKITIKSILRLIVFLFIVAFLIYFFDNQKNDYQEVTSNASQSLADQVIDGIYPKLPENSRNQIEHIEQTSIGKFFKNSSDYLKFQLNGFPQKQINQFKKNLIKKISNDLIENIDNQQHD